MLKSILIDLDDRFDQTSKLIALSEIFEEIDYSDLENKTAVKALIDNSFDEMNATQIININIKEIDYTTDADEYISISTGVSVWTYRVSGSFTTQGKTFTSENIFYETEVNRL
jgi:hypothetical protein